ncbi:tetratricopeptide repeat protein [Desulfolutivibrio sulfoxidireducens]|uniref:tetratricopeptide repeat protein n=1 Tax=Desulfolutivibrio sulfoxidireducens TaxID=2773299 RepID=UPI00159D2E62|nr:tetratricopeptide repeat protein [Desulfolutivibrio sulfoxidireducens]QLA19930.1 tetratricopeptide repeat protein [Desulfolutivibrio sulfoxidireducens]
MIEKIDLYREVLAIEPNSKVFFPLARELAGTGRLDEAVRTLEVGIGFHPDHLEATFLLVELLSRQDKEEEAVRVFSGVRESLIRYPSVWRLWSRHAAFASRDPVLALAFLAQYFRDPGLTFAEVLEKGLEVLAGAGLAPASEKPAPALAAVAAEMPEVQAEMPEVQAEMPEVQAETAVPEADFSVENKTCPASGAMPLRGADEVRQLAGLWEGQGEETLAASPEPGGGEAKAARTAQLADMGIRTRTMASLLAAQGDIQGAVDIYAELAAKLPSGPERDEIAARIAELSARGAAPVVPVAVPREAAPAPPKAKGKAKLIGLLDALAGRLEARVGP